MRKIVMLMAAVTLSACSSWDLSELHRIADYSEPVIDSTDRRYWTEDTYVHDTVVRFVAVEAEAGYNWRKDTLGGIFKGKLILFRNYKPELTLDIGPEYEISPDYASHFLIDGRLFTYYSTESVSVVKCNGKEVMRATGREELKGLLPTEEGILTLSKRASNSNFFVRLNGRDVMRFQADAVFGSMTDDSYPASGALYTDEGKNYFCYRTRVAGDYAYYIVENLTARVLSPPMDTDVFEIRDIKIDRGEIKYFALRYGTQASVYHSGKMEIFDSYPESGTYYDGRILANRGNAIAYGSCHTDNKYGKTMLFPRELNKRFLYFNNGFTIPGTGNAHNLLKLQDNHYLLDLTDNGQGPRIGYGCFCFWHRCSSALDDYIGIAFTPRQQNQTPCLWLGGEMVKVNVKNGYVTALSLTDSVTTIPGGFHPELVK